MVRCARALLESACAEHGLFGEEAILDWLQNRRNSYRYSVERAPLDRLSGWDFDEATGDLVHASGRFFRIRGVEFFVGGAISRSWQQPIIDQPEIGVLGFIAKNLSGVLHVLVQAKMEPGNINLVQLSPTVQATRSNYTMVHGGKRPRYIEYFLGGEREDVLYDQLQSEQGTRYFRKRNRNMIVEIPEGTAFEPDADFIWMTIGQLQRLARHDDLVHLDCRSILGGLSFYAQNGLNAIIADDFGRKIIDSTLADVNEGEHSQAAGLSWLTEQKFSYETRSRIFPLREVNGWTVRDGVIRHQENRFFSIVGVSVEAESREVASWTQPLVKSNDGGIIALIAQVRRGLLHFLIQGRAEPGLMDVVELAPTVQCTPANYCGDQLPPYVNLVQDIPQSARLLFDSMLSEEGGRFYHSRQRHLIVELAENYPLDLERNYCWMTLRQIQECGRYSNHLNIELRSVLSCVSPLLVY